jgi:hypothetical protein
VPTILLKNLFCPPVLRFCRRKKVKDKMRNMTFLLAIYEGYFSPPSLPTFVGGGVLDDNRSDIESYCSFYFLYGLGW